METESENRPLSGGFLGRMILVGVDFQEGSWVALNRARELSRMTGLPVEVLHVTGYGESPDWKPDPGQVEWLEKAGLSPSEVKTRSGVPWVELVRYARERGAFLIVAGRHGGMAFQPAYLGSTAYRLATSAPDPVLLVSAAPEVLGEGGLARVGRSALGGQRL